MEPKVLHFGVGAFVLEAGFFNGVPAMFIQPINPPGKTGDLVGADEHVFPDDYIPPGTTVLTFGNDVGLETFKTILDNVGIAEYDPGV